MESIEGQEEWVQNLSLESAQHPHRHARGPFYPGDVSLQQLMVRHGVGGEEPTVRTGLFAEPGTTLPAALFHVWGKAVCSKLGTVIKYHGFCKHLVACRLVLSHDGWMLFYLQVIKQLEVKHHEKGRAAISHHPMKGCNLLPSLNLICSS